ncbi:rhodanese-related sulfurtransferase [Arthrobacter sp. UYEF20]
MYSYPRGYHGCREPPGAAGSRSAQAAAYLEDQGYDAVNVAGGINEWQLDGLPVVRR